MTKPGRSVNPTTYRHGFNGMEADNDVKSDRNHYSTYFRQYDPRLGRWFSNDPVVHAWQSPYCSMDNNPIALNDPNGDDTKIEGGNRGKLGQRIKTWFRIQYKRLTNKTFRRNYRIAKDRQRVVYDYRDDPTVENSLESAGPEQVGNSTSNRDVQIVRFNSNIKNVRTVTKYKTIDFKAKKSDGRVANDPSSNPYDPVSGLDYFLYYDHKKVPDVTEVFDNNGDELFDSGNVSGDNHDNPAKIDTDETFTVKTRPDPFGTSPGTGTVYETQIRVVNKKVIRETYRVIFWFIRGKKIEESREDFDIDKENNGDYRKSRDKVILNTRN